MTNLLSIAGMIIQKTMHLRLLNKVGPPTKKSFLPLSINTCTSAQQCLGLLPIIASHLVDPFRSRRFTVYYVFARNRVLFLLNRQLLTLTRPIAYGRTNSSARSEDAR